MNMKRLLLTIIVSFLSGMLFAQVELSKLTTKWVTVGNEEIEIAYLDGTPYSGKVFLKHSNGKIGLLGEYKNGRKEGTDILVFNRREKTRINISRQQKRRNYVLLAPKRSDGKGNYVS